MPIIISGFNSEERKVVETALQKASQLVSGLDRIPHKAGSWFKFKYLQMQFKTFFGQHSVAALNAFRTVIWKINFSGLRIERINRRDSFEPEYQHVDLGAVHACTKGRTIKLGDLFFSDTLNEEARVLTLFHELTHVYADTKDFGLTAAKSDDEVSAFAARNPKKALESAYCFECFARSQYPFFMHMAEEGDALSVASSGSFGDGLEIFGRNSVSDEESEVDEGMGAVDDFELA